MAPEPDPPMRTTIRDEPEGLTLLIPAPQPAFEMVFHPIWLACWAFGEVAGIAALFFKSGTDLLFTTFWLVGWTMAGAVILLLWRWTLSGQVRVLLAEDRLQIGYELFGHRRTREYQLADVRNLRVVPESTSVWAVRSWASRCRRYGFGGGVVAFDHGEETVRFGAWLDEAEGESLVRRMLERHPSLRGDAAVTE